MKKRLIKNHGFSLVEVLFAMFFLSLMVFGIIKLQTSNLVLTSTQNNGIQGHFIATQALEIAEAIGETDLTGASAACGAFPCDCNLAKSVIPPIAYTLSCPGVDEVFGLFTRTLTLDNTGLVDAWKVTSTVGWEDASGSHTASAKRIISQ